MGRVIINGREVSNPIARFFIKLLALVLAGGIVAVMLFLVLPAVGVAMVTTVGLALLVAILAVLAVPILLISGTVVGIIFAPVAILLRGFFGKHC